MEKILTYLLSAFLIGVFLIVVMIQIDLRLAHPHPVHLDGSTMIPHYVP